MPSYPVKSGTLEIRKGHWSSRGLVRAYLNEGRGTTKFRDRAQNVTGSSAAAQTWVGGRYGWSMTMASPITGKDGGLPTGSKPSTVTFLIRTTYGGPYKTIVSWGTGIGGQKRNIYLSYTNLLVDSWSSIISGSVVMNDGGWHVVSVVMDGTTAIYVDGKLDTAAAQSIATVGDGTFAWGDESSSTTAYARPYAGVGDADLLLIHSRSLTADEVRRLHANPLVAFETRSPDPAAWAAVAGNVAQAAYPAALLMRGF